MIWTKACLIISVTIASIFVGIILSQIEDCFSPKTVTEIVSLTINV